MNKRYKYVCIRQENTVIVQIMFNRNIQKYQFVNLTHNHICPCTFDTVEDAIADMEREKQEGKLIDYFKIDDVI